MPFLSTMSIDAPLGEVPKPVNGAVAKTTSPARMLRSEMA